MKELHLNGKGIKWKQIQLSTEMRQFSNIGIVFRRKQNLTKVAEKKIKLQETAKRAQ